MKNTPICKIKLKTLFRCEELDYLVRILLPKLFQPIVGILEEKLRVTIDINGMDIEADGVYGLAVNRKTRLLAKSHLLLDIYYI